MRKREGAPLSSDETTAQLDIKDLERLVVEKGAKFPKDWELFDDLSKRRAIAGLLRGGLTNSGFETLTADWLEQASKMVERNSEHLATIDHLQNQKKEDFN